jgi:hypothetical protein
MKTKSGKSDDPFMEEYAEVEAELEKLLEVGGHRSASRLLMPKGVGRSQASCTICGAVHAAL